MAISPPLISLMNKRKYLGVSAILVGLVLAVAAFALYPAITSGDPEAVEESLVRSGVAPAATTVPTAAATSDAEPTREPIWQGAISDGTFGNANDQPKPVGLRIERLGVSAPVEPYGVNPRSGQMDVPRNVSDVAWYKHGPTPGSPGSAVLAAHVDLSSQGPGVFFNLKKVEAGDLVYVSFENGEEIEFIVEARTTYSKEDLPTDAIFSNDGPAVLTLITCGGGFSESAQSYDSNVVVYAVPSDATLDNPTFN